MRILRLHSQALTINQNATFSPIMNMRFLTVVLSTIFLLTANQTLAQDGIGIGGELLSPTGISYKVPINESSAITGAFGIFLTNGSNQATIEINYTNYRDSYDIDIGSGNLLPYISAGLFINLIENNSTISVQIPVGIEYQIDNSPFEIYMDMGPFLLVDDPYFFTFNSSLGFRYRF